LKKEKRKDTHEINMAWNCWS